MKRFLILLGFCLLLSGCGTIEKPVEYSQTEFLMDTVCTIRCDKEDAISDAFALMGEIQKNTDRYNETSTVSAFSRAEAGVPVPLDVHTEAILQTALAVSEASAGAFDVTIAPASALWAFGEDSLPPTRQAVAEVLPLIGWEYLILDTENHTLTKTKEGVALDLGGCAKGYAGDMAVELLKQKGATRGVLDLGGNVLVFGENPNRKDGSWEVGIQAPGESSGVYTETVSLTDAGAVVTSGTYQRNFSYAGTFYHHILNPKTGFPAETEFAGATVVCDSALLADCLSTACLMLGREKGLALAKSFDATAYFID